MQTLNTERGPPVTAAKEPLLSLELHPFCNLNLFRLRRKVKEKMPKQSEKIRSALKLYQWALEHYEKCIKKRQVDTCSLCLFLESISE